MTPNKFSIRKRFMSFKHAYNGFKILFFEEHNSRIHLAITVIVLTLGVVFRLSNFEWVAVLLAIGFVFAMELLNSSIENLADVVTIEKDERIKKIKDLAAAGVLMASVCSLIVGFIVFIPKIWHLFR